MTAFRRLAPLLALAGFLSLLVATTGSGSSPPLRIAVEGPQAGSQAPNGLDQLRGVRLAVSQLNAHGGLWNGRKVAIFRADDKAEASRGKAVARQVIAKRIRFVIGPYNSSVGLANLSIYRRHHVLPLWMTSEDKTGGVGATVQPMNSQIAPIEARYVETLHAKKVAMLVDDTANGAFTKGMATRLRAALQKAGASVGWISIKETTAKGLPSTYYADEVSKALGTKPDLVYVSTYFPEGVRIAKALAAAGANPPCLMGLANVDNAFVAQTTLSQAQRCDFSGVPAATEMPSAKAMSASTEPRSARSRVSGARSPTTRRESCSGRSTGQRASTSRRSSARSVGRKVSTAPPGRSRSARRRATARSFRSASSA